MDIDVLIVGAGPVGVTLAALLVRAGVAVRLIERAVAPFAGSRGKTLQPRTLELMDDLGVIDGILAHGGYTPPIRVHLPGGKSELEHLFGDRRPTGDTPYPRPFTIAQNLTEAVLRGRLAELGGAIAYGTTLTALAQGDAWVEVLLSCAGEETVARARYVVGCDGGGSTVRGLLGIAFEGDTDESRRLYVADVRLSGLDRETWHNFRGLGGMLNLAPLATTDLFQCQAAIPPGAPAQASVEGLQEIITSRSGRNDIRVREMVWCSSWRLNVRLASAYRVGRVFLAGDAGHVHSPAGAQGLNTGFQDAFNLGWKLAAVLGGAPPVLLDSYEAERRPIAAWVLGMTTALETVAYEQNTFPTDREEASLHLSLTYRGSALAAELRAAPGSIRAGDRMPDVPARGASPRLFDLLRGPRPVVLAFGAGWGEALAEVRSRYAPERLTVFAIDGEAADPGGAWAASLGIVGDALLVVRPDNYLGLAVDASRAGSVAPYLRRLIG